MKNISYWLDKPYKARPALLGGATADVVIVGAGITGVSAAYHCAKQGLKTILIEKNTVASGAAGKNGGMIVEGLSVPFITATEEIGIDQAKKSWLKTIEARKLVQDLIKDNAIDCDLSQTGSLLVALSVSEAEFLRKEADARVAAGIATELLERRTQLKCSPFDLELYNPSDCMMDPVKFVRGLARVAEEYGAIVYEHTPAVRFDAHVVTTPNGTITAERVVLAMESGHPFSNSDKVTITTEQAIVTEPLSDQQIAGLDWNIGGMFWTLGEDYYNIRKIGSRLLTSGRIHADATEEELDLHREKLIGIIQERLPSLCQEDIVISHCWTGVTLRSTHEWPTIRKQDGLYEIFGSGDFGFTNGVMAGKFLAESFFKNEQSDD